MVSYQEMRRRELKHIEETLKDDRKLKREIARLYSATSEDIEKLIEADIGLLAASENVSLADAKRIIKRSEVEAYERKVEKLIKDSKTSPEARKELRRYNVTLRSNRLELLQAQVNLNTLALSMDADELIGKHIADEVIQEYKRQAGILGSTLMSSKSLDNLAKSVLLSNVGGATFSDRIWADQRALTASINQAIERSLIRGEHPRRAIADIKKHVRKDVQNKRYSAERIAITETARGQSIAMEQAFKDADVTEYIWIAEPDACPECSALDGKTFKVNSKNSPKPPDPHPNCRCSIAGHVS